MKRFEKFFFQGDVAILKLPAEFKLSETRKEVPARNGRLVLQEGEVTGHFHAIDTMQRPAAPPQLSDEEIDALAHKAVPQVATARLYKDDTLTQALVKDNMINTSGLVVGYLLVEGGPMDVTHDEHSAIKVPPGLYYVGSQRQWDSEQERRIAD